MQGFLHTIPRGRNFTMCGGGEILIFNSDFSEFAWFNMGEVRDLPECEIALILVMSCSKPGVVSPASERALMLSVAVVRPDMTSDASATSHQLLDPELGDTSSKIGRAS